jgi:hypothetical protein
MIPKFKYFPDRIGVGRSIHQLSLDETSCISLDLGTKSGKKERAIGKSYIQMRIAP